MNDLFPIAVIALVALGCWVCSLLIRNVLKESREPLQRTRLIRVSLGLIGLAALLSWWLPIIQMTPLAHTISKVCFPAAVFGWLAFETGRAWYLSVESPSGISAMFRVTIRDWFWFILLFAVCFGWYSQRHHRENDYQQLRQQNKDEWVRHVKENREIVQRSRELEKYYVEKDEAAIHREMELKTTVTALRLRLGEDPLAKPSDSPTQ